MSANPMLLNQPTYTPRTGSLADRVVSYFRQQPEEELTRADVASKFDVPRASVQACLKDAVEDHLINYNLAEDGQWVYTAGKTLQDKPAWPGTPAGATAERAPGVSRRGIVKLPPSVLDFSALQAEKGVPLVGKSLGVAGVSKWAPLFEKLSEPDTSVQFPAAWKSAVAAKATKFNVAAKKAGRPEHYMVRITGPATARIWRTA